MGLYAYKIVTTNSEAEGTILASDEASARSQLITQYVPADHGFADDKGNPVEHNLVSIDLKAL